MQFRGQAALQVVKYVVNNKTGHFTRTNDALAYFLRIPRKLIKGILMRSLNYFLFLGTACLALSGCGGGGGSETPVTANVPPAPAAQSEYDRQTKAASDAFEKSLNDALDASNEWLDNNRQEADVQSTNSGLQYRVDTSSSNPTGKKYEGDQTVTVHYEGSLTDGTIFDSSFERGRPESLKPSELIQGWQEALNLMQPGDEWTLYLPPALGYGEVGKAGSVPPNAVLIYKVQLR